ncbi:BrnT family toxin [Pusillimonas sp.]|uniref:BrnT family toxin n=1 Tax=Pusillimonas sp. TaxID=3040095 RepID=UPI0029A34E2B|nr:BrnT family toxin [Pusillimonas sp.]MDX3894870.1 BrnT family toxin [Pusillimonas sp.]
MDFHEVAAFDWDNALVKIDTRRDYGELRWIALGLIKRRLHVMVYSRRSDTIRLISLRKANRREFFILCLAN